MRTSRRVLTALAALAAVTVIAATPVVAQAQTASVRVVHGIPGGDVSPDLDPALPVDVLVNDAICLASGFTFGTIAGPFTIPAGTYNVKVGLANSLEPCSGDAVIEADVPVASGENASIVAHLAADGAPTASKFVNDVSAPAAGHARLIAHHVANAPMVDILVPRNVLFVPNVSNTAGMNQAAGEVPATQLQILILPAGTNTPVFSRLVLLQPGLSYTVYAVGSLANGTFTLIAEPIGGLGGFTIRF